MFSAVKGATEAELLYARRQCRGLGWRGEVACDAELLSQCQTLKGGRGKVDSCGIGIGAAIRAQAQKTHDSVETIRLNIRIYKTFFETIVARYDSLEDKGYYHAALRAPNPLKAIEFFAKEFKSNESFTVSEARHWAISQREKRNTSANKIDAKSSPGDKSMTTFLRNAMLEIANLKSQCPDKDFAKRFFPQIIEELEEQLAVMAEDRADALCRMAWEHGHYREQQMALFTGLSRKDVSVVMNRLSEAQEFWEVEEHTHGRHDKRWQKAGVPLVGDLSARKVG